MAKNAKSVNTLANLKDVVAAAQSDTVKQQFVRMTKPDLRKINVEFGEALIAEDVELEAIKEFFARQTLAAETLNKLHLREAEKMLIEKELAQDPDYIRLKNEVESFKKQASVTYFVGTVRVRALQPSHPIMQRLAQSEERLANMRNTKTMLVLQNRISKLLTLINKEGFFELLGENQPKGQ